jgi:chromosome segregation ATPase
MRTHTTALLISALAALLLVACTPEPGTETERVDDQMQENRKEMTNADDAEEWLDERREAREELADLRQKLDSRMLREEKRLADGIKDAEKRAECENHIAELKANIARIDASIATVDASTDSDWEKLKAETRAAADETETWFNEQVEKIDRATDADNDNDGH